MRERTTPICIKIKTFKRRVYFKNMKKKKMDYNIHASGVFYAYL